MNPMSDSAELVKAQIDQWRQATGAVHVDDPSAYEAFSEGKLVFGHQTEAEKIEAFKKRNASEFGSAIVVEARTINPGALSFIWLYHKHRYQERAYKSDAMMKAVQERPDLA